MKALQVIVLLASIPGTSGILLAEETPQNTASQQTLTFPPSTRPANQAQYPGTAQPGPSFPSQSQTATAPQQYYYGYGQQQSAYPYSNYNAYGRQQPGYGYTSPYAPSYYYPYAYNYNPYARQQQRMMPYQQRPMPPQKKEVKPWGDTRYIWPDFYTDFTADFWDEMINAPYDLGRMPGGWRFPSFSSPDPVTVSDAIANQVPPFVEEAGNMMPAEDIPNILPF